MERSAPTIGLIGVGNLGSALARGFLRERPAPSLLVFDKDPARPEALSVGSPSVVVAESAQEVARSADVVIIAVKPQDMDQTLRSIAGELGSGQAVVSTAAGVTLDRLRAELDVHCTLFRVMPNLAVAHGEGVVAVAPEEGTAGEEVEALERLLAGLGLVRLVAENHFDAVTALTGSGPGFLALVLEGLEDGGVEAGLPREVARAFVQQTALGTAHLLREEGLAAAALKDRVSSPGGTTIAGLAVLEDRGVRGALLRAVQAAVERSRRL